MALGQHVSDLEPGDVLQPVRYVMTPFIAREYCHGVDEVAEVFHSPSAGGVQYAPPTLVHIDKIRLLKRNCPLGAGPSARIHYEYHATHHEPVHVGTELIASGEVSRKYQKRGRDYIELRIELRSAQDGQLFTSYRDTAVLSYSVKEERR